MYKAQWSKEASMNKRALILMEWGWLGTQEKGLWASDGERLQSLESRRKIWPRVTELE